MFGVRCSQALTAVYQTDDPTKDCLECGTNKNALQFIRRSMYFPESPCDFARCNDIVRDSMNLPRDNERSWRICCIWFRMGCRSDWDFNSSMNCKTIFIWKFMSDRRSSISILSATDFEVLTNFFKELIVLRCNGTKTVFNFSLSSFAFCSTVILWASCQSCTGLLLAVCSFCDAVVVQ